MYSLDGRRGARQILSGGAAREGRVSFPFPSCHQAASQCSWGQLCLKHSEVREQKWFWSQPQDVLGRMRSRSVSVAYQGNSNMSVMNGETGQLVPAVQTDRQP